MLYFLKLNAVKSQTHHNFNHYNERRIMYIATIKNGGFTYYLRGRTWACNEDRAFKYETLDAITDAINAVKDITKPALRKLITIEKLA